MPQTDIDLNTLAKYFHLPITEVARKLGVCATVLKKICRRYKIPRWPHRKVKSIEKAISSVEISIQKSPEEAPKLMIELDALKAKKEYLLKNPWKQYEISGGSGDKSHATKFKASASELSSRRRRMRSVDPETPAGRQRKLVALSASSAEDSDDIIGAEPEEDDEDSEDNDIKMSDEEDEAVGVLNGYPSTSASGSARATPSAIKTEGDGGEELDDESAKEAMALLAAGPHLSPSHMDSSSKTPRSPPPMSPSSLSETKQQSDNEMQFKQEPQQTVTPQTLSAAVSQPQSPTAQPRSPTISSVATPTTQVVAPTAQRIIVSANTAFSAPVPSHRPAPASTSPSVPSANAQQFVPQQVLQAYGGAIPSQFYPTTGALGYWGMPQMDPATAAAYGMQYYAYALPGAYGQQVAPWVYGQQQPQVWGWEFPQQASTSDSSPTHSGR